MPFAGFKDWKDSMEKLQANGYSKESAQKIAGSLKAKYEGSDDIPLRLHLGGPVNGWGRRMNGTGPNPDCPLKKKE
jgi:hypothetical protein